MCSYLRMTDALCRLVKVNKANNQEELLLEWEDFLLEEVLIVPL